MPSVSFSGLASGIDGDALIKAMMESRRVAKVPLENKVTSNENETSALEELNKKLLGLRSVLESFQTYRGGGLQKSASSSNQDAITIAAGSGAPNTTTEVEVIQLAKGATFSFGNRFASSSAPLVSGLSEETTVKVKFGSGETLKEISIKVTPGMTVSAFVDELNKQSEGYANASLLNTGTQSSPQYVLTINGLKTGEEAGKLEVEIPQSLTSQGLLSAGQLNQARNAIIRIDGVGEIQRENNILNDVIPGATLEIKQPTLGKVTLGIASDPEKTADKVQEMIAAINELALSSKEQSLITRVENNGKYSNSYGDLARTRVDEQVVGQLRNALSSTRAPLGGKAIRIFADLGITTQKDGSLAFDRNKFVDSLNKEPAAVDGLLSQFADKLASASGTIAQYTHYQGIIDSAKDANQQDTESIQAKLERMERSIEAQAASMRMTFARLESSYGRAQQDGSALTTLMSAIGDNQG